MKANEVMMWTPNLVMHEVITGGRVEIVMQESGKFNDRVVYATGPNALFVRRDDYERLLIHARLVCGFVKQNELSNRGLSAFQELAKEIGYEREASQEGEANGSRRE